MGVATADGTYGAIAAFGLTAVTELLVDWRRALGIVGGTFLLWLAYKTFTSVPGEAAAETERRRGLPGAYLSMLGLTLTNPMTILSFAALFVGLGVTGGDPAGATVLTLGVFAGSSLWWVVLTTVARGVPVASDDERHASDQHGLGAAHRSVRARRHRDRATVNPLA